MRFLTLDHVIALHYDQIEQYGGSHGIRDLGLLESAVFRSQLSFGGEDLYPSVFDKAACLLHGLIANHPFIDGNKRTAVATMLMFLMRNGYHLSVEQDTLVENAIAIATKQIEIEDTSHWLEKNCIDFVE